MAQQDKEAASRQIFFEKISVDFEVSKKRHAKRFRWFGLLGLVSGKALFQKIPPSLLAWPKTYTHFFTYIHVMYDKTTINYGISIYPGTSSFLSNNTALSVRGTCIQIGSPAKHAVRRGHPCVPKNHFSAPSKSNSAHKRRDFNFNHTCTVRVPF